MTGVSATARLLSPLSSYPVILPSVKTAISVPDDAFETIERAVTATGMNRSEFYTKAAVKLAADVDEQRVVDAVNAALDRAGDSADDDVVWATRQGQRVLADQSSW